MQHAFLCQLWVNVNLLALKEGVWTEMEELHEAPRSEAAVLCVSCVWLCKRWAHRRDVSAPLHGPDVHGKCAHVNCVGVICVASQLSDQTCNPTSSKAGAKR